MTLSNFIFQKIYCCNLKTPSGALYLINTVFRKILKTLYVSLSLYLLVYKLQTRLSKILIFKNLIQINGELYTATVYFRALYLINNLFPKNSQNSVPCYCSFPKNFQNNVPYEHHLPVPCNGSLYFQ